MKIGALVFLTEQSGNPGAIARECENLGFESFFVAEHMAVPSTYTTHYPRSRDGKVPEFYARLIDPFVALSIAAAATSRIKIGTAICLLPQRDVIETAKVTASIDLYSKGRLDPRRRRGMVSRGGAGDGRRFRAALAASARIS